MRERKTLQWITYRAQSHFSAWQTAAPSCLYLWIHPPKSVPKGFAIGDGRGRRGRAEEGEVRNDNIFPLFLLFPQHIASHSATGRACFFAIKIIITVDERGQR